MSKTHDAFVSEKLSGLFNVRIVVTGAAGFIGGQLLQTLRGLYASSELLAVDHPLKPAMGTPTEAFGGVEFLNHTQFLEALTASKLRPELIFHLGACSSTIETDWDYLVDNNLAYSQKLWTWAASNSARLLYASSAATYGDGENGFDDTLDLMHLRPLNLYGKSKHDFDLWIDEQKRERVPQPVQSVGFKFFNVFGPGEGHKGRMASMVWHGYHQILKGGTVRLFESHRPDYTHGGQLRDFIYVKDVVRVMLSFAERREVSGLFNLGTGQARSFRDLIEATFASLGRHASIEYIPMPEDLRGRYQYFTQATMIKTTGAGVAYNPTPLEDAVADYVAWLQENS
jgi:ADP-L-glycero-D-manno-heptose 6-epimerase